jgi:hypothetical protein
MRQHVDRCQLLGQEHGMAHGQYGDAGRQADAIGQGGEGGEAGDELDARLVGRVRRVGREGHVIAHPQGLEAGVLGPVRPPGQHARVDAAALVEPVQAPVHRDVPMVRIVPDRYAQGPRR